jgi:hypothetical protein
MEETVSDAWADEDEGEDEDEGLERPSEDMVVHYYLQDDKHSMDAYVRNRAEGELLGMIRHILLQLNLDVKVEAGARREGGLIDTLVLIANNPALLVTAGVGAAALLAQIISIIVTVVYARDKGLDANTRQLLDLNIEEKKLAIEEKKLAIEKARAELLKANPDPIVIRNVLPVIEQDSKTVALRSNFFKVLISTNEIRAIGMGPKLKHGEAAERIVKRDEFRTYVRHSDKLPTVVHHDAAIEIVAPVIGKGKFQWRGIWQGQPITFSMRDPAYRAMVQRGQEVFRTGDAIKCELNVERKIDIVGDEIVTGHVVTTVIAKIEGTKEIVTAKGKQLRFEKEHGPQNQAQLNLLLREDDEG